MYFLPKRSIRLLVQNTSRDFRNRFFLISQKLLALSIRCSEMYGIINNIFRKNTQKSNLFERNQYLLSSFSSTQERRFFFQGEHDFGPETMEENNKSRSLHKMKFNIHLYTKKTQQGEPLIKQKNKKIHGWFVCYYSVVGSLIPSSRGQELHCRIHGVSLATTLPRHGAIDGQHLGLRTAIAWGLANGRAPCFNWFMMELNYIVLPKKEEQSQQK